MLYTTDELNAILASSYDRELRLLSVATSQKPKAGGMSNGVYEARMQGSEKRWALKVIDAEDFSSYDGTEASNNSLTFLTEKLCQAEREIIKEKQIHKDMSSLRNQYFVQAVKLYEDQRLHIIRMPYYDGLLDYDGEPEETAIRLGLDLCQALLALHFNDKEMGHDRHGVLIHGDIKPQNIFFQESDGRACFKLGDFGSVRHLGEPCRSRSDGYYAPEVQFGSTNVGPSADLFSLGLVLYWYVCGKDNCLEYQMWEYRCAGIEPCKPSACSEPLWETIIDATEPDPEDRIQTADEMLERLLSVSSRKLADYQKKNQELQEANDIKSTILGLEAIIGISVAAGALAGKIFDMVTGRKQQPRLFIKEVDGWYEGAVEGNYPSGKGTYHYADSSSRSGNWSWAENLEGTFFGNDVTGHGMLCNDIACGFWIIQYKDAWSYRGEMKDGSTCGKGKFQFWYHGEIKEIFGRWDCKENTKLGTGKQAWIYTGMMCNNIANGRGRFEISGAGIFDGVIYNGSVIIGRYEQYNGETYDGEWEMEDSRSVYGGYGIQTYPDGRRYEGMWKQGKRHGEGTFTDNSGKSIRAIWEDDQIKQLL